MAETSPSGASSAMLALECGLLTTASHTLVGAEGLQPLSVFAVSAADYCWHTIWQVQKKLRGCIVFTSSAAAAIASPFTALYAATKSFVSSFGASLAVEVRHHGIDVLVFHPSPVNTRCRPISRIPSRHGHLLCGSVHISSMLRCPCEREGW